MAEPSSDKTFFKIVSALFFAAGVATLMLGWVMLPSLKEGFDRASRGMGHVAVALALFAPFCFGMAWKYWHTEAAAAEKQALLRKPSRAFVIALLLIFLSVAGLIAFVIGTHER